MIRPDLDYAPDAMSAALTNNDVAGNDRLAAISSRRDVGPRSRDCCGKTRLLFYVPSIWLQISRPTVPPGTSPRQSEFNAFRSGRTRVYADGPVPTDDFDAVGQKPGDPALGQSWLWPRLRLEFCRRRFLKEIAFGPRVCSTIWPATLAPSIKGVPKAGSPSPDNMST